MKTKRFLLAASITLATVFTISCGEVGNDDPQEIQTSSSSIEGGGDSSSSSNANASSSSIASNNSSSSVIGSSSSVQGNSSASVCKGMNFNPQTQRCTNDVIETKCGSGYYVTKTQFCSNGEIKDKSTFIDERDNKTYTYVVIGTQTWMAENLNYKVDNSFCYGDLAGYDALKTCDTYGRLYNWTTAMKLPNSCGQSKCPEQIDEQHQGVCPNGWHIPTDDEWGILMETVEPTCTDYTANCSGAGLKLKAAISWNTNGEGNDEYGFAGLAGGRISQDVFDNMGTIGYWWTMIEETSNSAYRRHITSTENYRSVASKNGYWYNVRCVKNLE